MRAVGMGVASLLGVGVAPQPAGSSLIANVVVRRLPYQLPILSSALQKAAASAELGPLALVREALQGLQAATNDGGTALLLAAGAG